MKKHKSQYYQLLPDFLASGDEKSYKNFLRVDEELFHEILERLRPRIEKQDTNCRLAVSAAERLAITLRYFAYGELYKSLAGTFRVAPNTVSVVIRETCDAIIEEYMHELIKCPTTAEGWKELAEGFSKKWNFHHCIGSLDGKHIAMKKPGKSGSTYHNYKGFFSVVLMALVDYNYKFLYINVGAQGSSSDGGVFKDTALFKRLEKGRARLPPAEPLPGGQVDVPYFIVADDAFAMRTWLLKPYPHRDMTREERILNYRLSRARRIVENAFGILVSRFRVLLSTIQLEPDNVTKVVKACCILHNLLAEKRPRQVAAGADREDAETHQRIPGTWRDELDHDLLVLEPR